ncbi:MAG: PfkB family carbohydrate kinase [Pseudomonadota bacterium]
MLALAHNDKIRDLDELASILQILAIGGKRVVHCHGLFPLLDQGDIRHLEAAREMGDVLAVTLCSDDAAPDDVIPPLPDRLRAEMIAALPSVDYVAITSSPSASEAIHRLRPHIHATRSWAPESDEEAVLAIGGSIRCTTDPACIANNDQTHQDDDRRAFLAVLRERYTATEVLSLVESLRSLRVAIVGEAILDEYVYCDAMGKSGKEPMLVVRHRARDLQAGGALAIANHLAEFCDQIELCTYLGASDPREEFVRTHLRSAVRLHSVLKADSPTIVKRRYVDAYSRAKLFGVYQLNDEPLAPAEESRLLGILDSLMDNCDLVIAADYGHGFITSRAVDLICNRAPFLAVNTQLNSANVGFNTVSRYPRADYVCLHEGELRMDARNTLGATTDLMVSLARRMAAERVLVTQGNRGATIYQEGSGFVQCPAFADKIVDRVGAGDALLALSSLLVAAGAPPDMTAWLGNLAGAQAVSIVGNCSSIDRTKLMDTVRSHLRASARRLMRAWA